jgi:hypothetical protein
VVERVVISCPRLLVLAVIDNGGAGIRFKLVLFNFFLLGYCTLSVAWVHNSGWLRVLVFGGCWWKMGLGCELYRLFFGTVIDCCCAKFGTRNWRAGKEMSAVVMG